MDDRTVTACEIISRKPGASLMQSVLDSADVHLRRELKNHIEGIEETARELSLLDGRWRVLHDLRLADRSIDHLLVGPGGIFVITSRHEHRQPLAHTGEVVFVGDAALDEPLSSIKTAKAVGALLGERLGKEVQVSAIVSISCASDFASYPDAIGSVVAVKELTDWLERYPVRVSADLIEQVWSVLSDVQTWSDVAAIDDDVADRYRSDSGHRWVGCQQPLVMASRRPTVVTVASAPSVSTGSSRSRTAGRTRPGRSPWLSWATVAMGLLALVQVLLGLQSNLLLPVLGLCLGLSALVLKSRTRWAAVGGLVLSLVSVLVPYVR